MKFYRLEKENKLKFWSYIVVKGFVIGLIATIIIMLIAGYKFMIVSSGSMEPTLPVGSLVIVTPAEYEDLELYDIVTMDAGGVTLTHRIVGKFKTPTDTKLLLPGDEGYDEAYWWVTKGDYADAPLDGALTDEVIGKVYDAHAFSWVGTVVRYVRQNFQLVVILLILLIAFVSVLEWLKNKLIPDDIEVYDTEDEE